MTIGNIRISIFATLLGCFGAVVAVVPATAQLNQMACVSLPEVQSSDTPPRLARAVRDCIEQERYDDAMQVFLAYSVFGTFDQQRVRDVSGHTAFVELNSWIFGGYSRDVIDALREVSTRLREKGAFFNETCAGIRSAGWPSYRPSYMIERGILPRRNDQDWVTDGFEPVAAWQNALVHVNGCPAQ